MKEVIAYLKFLGLFLVAFLAIMAFYSFGFFIGSFAGVYVGLVFGVVAAITPIYILDVYSKQVDETIDHVKNGFKRILSFILPWDENDKVPIRNAS